MEKCDRCLRCPYFGKGICNKTDTFASNPWPVAAKGARGINQNQSCCYEFFTSIVGYLVSALVRYRKRLRFVLNCSTFDLLRLGPRGDSRIDHIEQSQLEIKI